MSVQEETRHLGQGPGSSKATDDDQIDQYSQTTARVAKLSEEAASAIRADFHANVVAQLGKHNHNTARDMATAVRAAEAMPKPPTDNQFRSFEVSVRNAFHQIWGLAADQQTVAIDMLAGSPVGACYADFQEEWDLFRSEQLLKQEERLRARLRDEYGAVAFNKQIDGTTATSLRDAQGPPPARWGSDYDVLWTPDETVMIDAGVGVGKTTLAGLLVRALIFGGKVLGLPVQPLEPGQRVLYLALDRPPQVRRSLARQFTEEQLDSLDATGSLVIRQRLLADPAQNPNVLRDMADLYESQVVIIDSLKDAVSGLLDEKVCSDYNEARKRLLGSGRELCELHHLTKAGGDYGPVWIRAGVGSVVELKGKAGGKTGRLVHAKQPADVVGPINLTHDRRRGEISVRTAATAGEDPNAAATTNAEKATGEDASPGNDYRDLADWVIDHHLDNGVTAKEAAQFLYGSTESRHLKAAKRALNAEPELTCHVGTGRGNESRWVYVSDDDGES